MTSKPRTGRRAALIGLAATWALAGCAAVPGSRAAAGGTPGGRLTGVLDGMDVESLWLPGYPIAWRTGRARGPIQTTPGGHTHCSAFAAAAADRLGIYLLRPPEHGQNWLANAQEEWLNGAPGGRVTAREAGWERIGRLAEPGAAQSAIARANEGHLVLAIYFQPPRDGRQRSGHVAIVRASEKPGDRVREEGPDVMQAGGQNHRSVPLRAGFAAHRDAWATGAIEFFWNHATA